MAAKPTIAIGHPLMGRGGSEFKVLWGIQSLREDYDITVVTGGGFDLEGLNALCGTSVAPGDFSLHQVWLPGFLQRQGAALRGSLYAREFRRLAPRFDLLISAYNPCDLGRRTIQCIADFSWHEELRSRHHPTPPGAARLVHSSRLARSLYLRLCGCVHPYDTATVLRRDLIIANSKWTAGHLKRLGASDVVLIYPPVTASIPNRLWSERKHGFVYIGRIVPEKRIEALVEIVERVRNRGHDLSLCILGEPQADAYGDQVRKLAAARADWLTLAGAAYGNQKAAMLSSYRFGLHGGFGEAFGIGVAEMTLAGCITFVRDNGGPAEIVAQPELIYASVHDAVAKIERVLENSKLQEDIRGRLKRQAHRYSAEEFARQFRSVVEKFIHPRRADGDGPQQTKIL